MKHKWSPSFEMTTLPVTVDLRPEIYVLRCSSNATLSTWNTPLNHTDEAQRQGTSLLPGVRVHVHKKLPLLCGSLKQGQTPIRICTTETEQQEKHFQYSVTKCTCLYTSYYDDLYGNYVGIYTAYSLKKFHTRLITRFSSAHNVNDFSARVIA